MIKTYNTKDELKGMKERELRQIERDNAKKEKEQKRKNEKKNKRWV